MHKPASMAAMAAHRTLVARVSSPGEAASDTDLGFVALSAIGSILRPMVNACPSE